MSTEEKPRMDLAQICRLAVRAGASDVHMKVGLPPVFRVHGDLRPVNEFPVVTQEALGLTAWDIMNPIQRERFKTTNDCDLAWTVLGVGRFRVNVFRQQGKIGMVLRTIPSTVRSIEELSLPPVLRKLALLHRGMILVTGATTALLEANGIRVFSDLQLEAAAAYLHQLEEQSQTNPPQIEV